MLLLLVLCLWVACSARNPDYSGITTVPAEGSISVPCGSYCTSPPPLVLKLQMEEHRNDLWVVVAMEPVVLKLDTFWPYIQLSSDGYNDTSTNYSCSVNNKARTAIKMKEWTDMTDWEGIVCHAPENWTLLQFSRGDDMIAMVHKAEAWINVMVDRNGSSFFISSTTEEDDGSSPSFKEPVRKALNVTCRWWTPRNDAKGWQLFLEGRYWIIVVVASSSALLCLMLMGCFVSVKRRRRVRRQAKSRFFKVSTTTRNLYTDSIDPGADVAYKDQDFTYQNVSLSKVVNDDCNSNKSSFLSVGGDSYLEPMVEGGDQVSDAGGCYENTTADQGDHQGSLDGDCYENASEEIKDGSEGSQSYEDMKGSVCIQTETETLPDEAITQDEDADSYENMQTPLYTQLNRIIFPPHKPTEEQAEGRKMEIFMFPMKPTNSDRSRVQKGNPRSSTTKYQPSSVLWGVRTLRWIRTEDLWTCMKMSTDSVPGLQSSQFMTLLIGTSTISCANQTGM